MSHAWFAASAAPRVLAHRGLVTPEAARLGIVDNTFSAVADAHAAGAIYIESDCHLSSDGVVILFHDDDLLRVAGDPRRVADVRAVELADILSDRGGLLTLEDALDAFPGVHFNLDVKAESAAVPVGRMIGPHVARILITSFSDRRRELTMRAVEGPRLPATSAGSGTVARLLGATALRSGAVARRVLRGVDAIQIPERQGRIRVLSPALLDLAHRNGVEVHVWTVNDTAEMRRLLALGVDGLVTDHADIALDVVARHRAG